MARSARERVGRTYKLNLPDNISSADLEAAINAFDAGVEHYFGRSTSYDMLYRGKRYPPKAIVGIASGAREGEPFIPDDFTGGIGSKCF